ncbi:MAG: hypothetical protein A3G34_05415 [Candidatus Lindowbacteria bacterium RIFCSPLOWO2_12_FULL_62_27]|nr:MAG: hypothetical protein A3G34_05415 [Candidatus Lindowbacteria bacterium RIFCSPLOWO2_12_FULL_62_27]OGH63934.1 MAG: hypothetical protein A3I06_03840 [Candidatus Lindowbacteria bacterium RIFCSPLOWO2_02_FULL_62_12]
MGWGVGVLKKNVFRARELRQTLTDAEKLLWRRLRLKQIEGQKFRRQAPIGNYIVDFVCFEKRLIVELDGGQHAEQTEYDEARDRWLESQGFRVIRVWNDQVMRETEAVMEMIFNTVTTVTPVTPHLDPPPQGGRK